MASILGNLIGAEGGYRGPGTKQHLENAINTASAFDTKKFGRAAQATGFNPTFRPLSILGAFQTSNQQGQQQALNQQLAGIGAAARESRRGFQDASRQIIGGTRAAVGRINAGLERGLGRLDLGLEQGLDRLDAGLEAGLGRLDEGLSGARRALAPLREATIGALGRFADLSGISGKQTDLASDPAFNFRFQQGQRAVQAAQAAGGIGGGRAAKELTEFGQGLAAEELTNQSNRLLNLIGIGAGALGQEASIEASTAAQAAGLTTSTASQAAGLTTATAGQAAGLEAAAGSESASLLANQGFGLAGLRSQLTQSLADAELARAQARSQSTLQNASVLRLLQQRGNLLSTRDISL